MSHHRDDHPGDAAAVARRFLHGLQEMDVEAAVRCFAEHGRQEMPFAPPGFPDRLDGVAELRRQYGGLPQAYTDMRFDISAVHPMADPEWVLLEYHGRITQQDGSRYDNDYAGLFHVVDGAIVLFREYFNPLVLQQAFGADELASTFTLSADRSDRHAAGTAPSSRHT